MKKTMDKIILAIALFLLAFTVVMIVLYKTTGGIPDTLCSCVFAACGGECGAMAWIKTWKERTKEREYEVEDREFMQQGQEVKEDEVSD